MTNLAQSTPEKVKEVRQFLKQTKNVRERDKARATLKLMEGRSRREVADFLEISTKTLDRWQQAYKRYGLAGLRVKPQPGNRRYLTNQQKEEIKKAITHQSPEQLGLEGKFWNVPRLKEYVKRQYGVIYRSPTSYRNLFISFGFSFHKPKKVNKKQDPHMRQRFVEEVKKNSWSTPERIVWSW